MITTMLRRGTSTRSAASDPQISRFPYKELLHMPGSLTAQDCVGTRMTYLCMLPSAYDYGVGVLKEGDFAARWLACTYLCQRFAEHLAMYDA
jgi:hypothetical protein